MMGRASYRQDRYIQSINEGKREEKLREREKNSIERMGRDGEGKKEWGMKEINRRVTTAKYL